MKGSTDGSVLGSVKTESVLSSGTGHDRNQLHRHVKHFNFYDKKDKWGQMSIREKKIQVKNIRTLYLLIYPIKIKFSIIKILTYQYFIYLVKMLSSSLNDHLNDIHHGSTRTHGSGAYIHIQCVLSSDTLFKVRTFTITLGRFSFFF